MIVRPRLSWLRLVFLFKGGPLPRVWKRVLVPTLLAVVVTLIGRDVDTRHVRLNLAPFTIVGVALGVFLGFRNNTGYDRYWEGRILWGQLVNTSRTFTRQVLTLVVEPARREERPGEAGASLPSARQRELVYGAIAFARALRLHLRDQEPAAELDDVLPQTVAAGLSRDVNPPDAILHFIGRRLQSAWIEGTINNYHLPVLEGSLEQLTDILGGCERIKNTPIPFSYTVLLHQTVAVYCLALPFALVSLTTFFTPLAVALVSYTFFGLDAVGDEIENPFGTEPNDLPLSAISRTIEINLRQRLGETDLPPALAPSDFVLQ